MQSPCGAAVTGSGVGPRGLRILDLLLHVDLHRLLKHLGCRLCAVDLTQLLVDFFCQLLTVGALDAKHTLLDPAIGVDDELELLHAPHIALELSCVGG